MQFKFKKVSQKGVIAIATLLLTVVLSAHHAAQSTHQSTEQPDVLAVVVGAAQKGTGRARAGQASGSTVVDGMYTPTNSTPMYQAVLPVVRISHIITEDQIWNQDHQYILDGPVFVPIGVTVTINGGTTVKINANGDASGLVIDGGRVVIVGSAQSPVVFSAVADSYPTAIEVRGGTLTANKFSISDAMVGIKSVGGHATLTAASIVHTVKALQVTGGEAIYRGAIRGATAPAIEACDWVDTECAVDAAFVDWGDDEPSACGKVLMSPWQSEGQSHNSELFRTNCSGLQTPSQLLAMHVAKLSDAARSAQEGCAGGAQEMCESQDSMVHCAASAVQATQESSIVTLPTLDTVASIASLTPALNDLMGEYLITQESMTGDRDTIRALLDVIGVYDLLDTKLATCTP